MRVRQQSQGIEPPGDADLVDRLVEAAERQQTHHGVSLVRRCVNRDCTLVVILLYEVESSAEFSPLFLRLFRVIVGLRGGVECKNDRVAQILSFRA